MNHWIMDLETLSNCFVGVFIHHKEDTTKIFTVHKSKNEMSSLLDFLEENKTNNEWHISFNGLAFDSQIIQHLLQSKEYFLELDGDTAARAIYQIAQSTIEKRNKGEYLDFYENKLSIRQLDVFKLNHWDNRAKSSSLKWIQYSMDWYNMQDMPIHHTTEIETKEELDEIITYCINDVLSTKEIFKLSFDQIDLRRTLSKEYNINLYSASEPKISKELFLDFLSKKIGKSSYELKQLRTYREQIDVKDIILDYVEFITPDFNKVLQQFKNTIINPNETKNAFGTSVFYKGVKTDFGLGGIHGARTGGIYKSEKGMIIMSSDVKSFYPNLAIRNKWSPAHLPKEEFCELYEWFYDERIKIPKTDIRNYVYKIILNSTYGLTNDKYSPFYDPLMTMQITINGQLSLIMLYEMLCESIPGSIPLMINTDGFEIMIREEDKDKYFEICKEWEEKTQLELEHDNYQKLIIGDVNNYIGLFDFKEVTLEEKEKIKKKELYPLFKEEGDKIYYAKTKCKGRFEFENLPLHKNKSFLVIRKAIYNYFIHGILPETYLASNTSIFDYCGGVKVKNPWNFYKHHVENGEYKKEKIQKVIRYYISNSGCKVIKHNETDKRNIQIESGKWNQKILNKYEEKQFKEYDINPVYYKQKVYDEINEIIDDFKTKQMSLF